MEEKRARKMRRKRIKKVVHKILTQLILKTMKVHLAKIMKFIHNVMITRMSSILKLKNSKNFLKISTVKKEQSLELREKSSNQTMG